MSGSVADRIAELLFGDDPVEDPHLRAELEAEAIARWNDWDFIARPEQLPPEGDWTIWPFVAGRGAGKTRSGSEWMLDSAEDYADAGVGLRGALVARTAADVRDTVVEGESGIMACCERRGIKAVYRPGKRRVELPDLGAELHTYTAMEPESLRGPQHHRAWGDEPAAWRHIVDSQGNTAWSNMMFGLRLDAPGLRPQVMATTTPKPILIVKEWFEAVDRGDKTIVMTRGTLYDNITNLAPAFAIDVVERYRNSPLGPQEIYGVLVLTVEGALWTPDRIQRTRVDREPANLTSRIVAVDPPGEDKAECGIITLGLGARQEAGYDIVAGKRVPLPPSRHVYVTGDWSMRGPPEEWGREVIAARDYSGARTIVVEKNQGGDMVRAVIHAIDPNADVEKITASVSKWQRAEPVAAVYSRVHHVATFPMLEAQMTTWTEDDEVSPDRLDALVHGVRHLLPDIVRAPARATSAVGHVLTPARSARR